MPKSEINAIISEVRIDNDNRDMVVQNELCLLLFQKCELLGFYILLNWASQVGLIKFTSQRQLALSMGLSEGTFIKRRRDLEKLGLLDVLIEGDQRVYVFHTVGRLVKFIPPKKSGDVSGYLKVVRQSLWVGDAPEEGQLPMKIPEKKEVQRFPGGDYQEVMAAYQKCKGVELKGAEKEYSYRAVKTMFKSGRTVGQIVKFMEWLCKNCGTEEHGWARLWTMWTVQKKMPEFLAGKLENESWEDKYERV